MANTPGADEVSTPSDDAPFVRPKQSPWVWLLVPAAVLPLLSFVWNRNDPTLFGMPFFYWIQLVLVLLASVCCGIVYQKTKSGSH